MNAILRFIFLAVLSALFSASTAFADPDPISAPISTPVAGALDLRPGDESDACVLGSLQIRANVIGVTAMGLMKLELYNADDGFLSKSGRLRSVRVAAVEGSQMICINVPQAGVYGVAGYHDRDGNRKLKKKWDFTPREPYGLSNNPEIKSRRIPKWEEVAFTVSPTGVDIEIILVDLKARKKEKKAAKQAQD